MDAAHEASVIFWLMVVCNFAEPVLTTGVNLASGCTTNQSSVKSGHTAGADVAIDGNRDGAMNANSCTYSDFGGFPWWGIDLGSVQTVTTVHVYNRAGASDRLHDLRVGFVSEWPSSGQITLNNVNAICATLNGTLPHRLVVIQCHPNATGRILTIQIIGSGNNVLTLCEVEVYATLEIPDGYGCGSNPCKNNGTCEEKLNKYLCHCNNGYTGITCETNNDECTSQPCQHGGACSDGPDKYTCTCVGGYRGPSCEIELPELDPPAPKEVSMSLVDANIDTCLILDDVDVYIFSSSMSQWLPQPQNECWRSGLVIKDRVPGHIHASFTVRLTGHRLVCSKSHLKVMTRSTELSDCGLVSGSVCKLSGVTESDPESLTTCVAACQFQENKSKYVTIEITKKHNGWKLCEFTIE